MKKTKNLLKYGYFVSIMLLSTASGVFAQDGIQNPLGNTNSLVDLVVKIVQAALGLTAVVAVAYVVYGGFLYITAAGDSKQVESGKTAVIGAVIGIIVIGLAYAIVQFVVTGIGGGGGGAPGSGGTIAQ